VTAPDLATTYDELPYLSKAIPQTHPNRLAMLARLFGLQPPELASCRVLELGCASGGNIVPMALGLPNATFVGIDLSSRQIEQGRELVSALGLANVELRQYDIADIDPSWGKFDYIISHGVYSWVPAPVREKLLAVCNDNLADNGVAYVSYNTLPGWRMRGMIRDMMIYHSRGIEGASGKVAQARALLEFLAGSAAANTPYGMMLREEAQLSRGYSDVYLFHEYLEEHNQAFYFHEFVDEAARHGLGFLAEADLGSMLLSSFPPEVAQRLQRIAPDIIRMEQHMDFLRNRMFRQTLLVHQRSPIQRTVNGLQLSGMLLSSNVRPESGRPVLAHGVSEPFVIPAAPKQMVSDALTKAALVVMGKEWPRCFAFEELYQLSLARLREEIGDAPVEHDDMESFAKRMLQAYTARAVDLRVAAPRLALSISERPVASPLARYQLASGARVVTNLRHELTDLPELPRRVLMLLDGTRDAEDVATDIVKLGKSGTIVVREQEGGPAVTDPARIEFLLRATVADTLPRLLQAALLLQ